MKKSTLKQLLINLEDKLEEIFVDKNPYQIPKNIKELLVDYGPYLLAVFLFFQLEDVLKIHFLNFSFFKLGLRMGLFYQLQKLFLIISLVIQAVALPGLFQKKLTSWRLFFYISLLWIIIDVLIFDIFGLIISSLFSWYILFQIKEYYK